MNSLGIYIHIPFCKSKCHYCNFNSYQRIDNKIEEYINALCHEIINNTEILSSYEITTIYFGGGTPSYIDPKYIVQIMELLRGCTNISDNAEITIELNPGTVNYEKLSVYKEIGINRISIGLQDSHDEVLKNIGRIHTYSDYCSLLELIKKLEFKNYSTDIIYGLPGQTKLGMIDTLKSLITSNVPHISVYGLELHQDSKLDFLVKNKFLTLPSEDDEMDIKHTLEYYLEENGYSRYEIANYSKPTFESKHNLNYWNQGNYLGFGAGASSYMFSTRYTNVLDIGQYINCIENNNNIHTDIEEMDLLDTIKEYCILQLRLKDGINLKSFYSKFKKDIFELYSVEINKLISEELLVHNNDNIYLTNKGKDLANIVWQEFI